MRVGISNIAWDVPEDEQVATLLQQHQVDAIDIAPGKYFPVPKEASLADIQRVRQWWLDRGIEITGMQALLFGTSGLNVFGSPNSQAALLDHLGGVCRIAGELQAPRLVFGSPKNRDRSGLSDSEAEHQAVSFFRRLGDVALANGVLICLEPNPPCYGANFMVNSDDTAKVVRAIDHPAIRMQLDTGAIAINAESVDDILAQHAPLIGHVHASEPDLAPLGDRGADHARMGRALAMHLPQALVSIEMVATKEEPHLASIERALQVALQHYRSPQPTGLAS
jgi:sugar phosphate isomerase/epimerase